MRCSVCSDIFHDLSPEETVSSLIDSGFSFTELSHHHAEVLLARNNFEKSGRELHDLCVSQGFCIPQGHLKLWADICAEDTEKELDELKRWLTLFHAIGIKNAVLHCGGTFLGVPDEQLLDKRVESLNNLANFLEGTDICICLENTMRVVNTCESLLQILNALNRPNRFGICFDTGHLNKTGGKPAEFLHRGGSRVKALHIHDNEGTHDQHLLPYSKGNINWQEFMTALKEIGYDGLFNFEIHGEIHCPLEIRKYKLEYIKKLTEYMLKL